MFLPLTINLIIIFNLYLTYRLNDSLTLWIALCKNELALPNLYLISNPATNKTSMRTRQPFSVNTYILINNTFYNQKPYQSWTLWIIQCNIILLLILKYVNLYSVSDSVHSFPSTCEQGRFNCTQERCEEVNQCPGSLVYSPRSCLLTCSSLDPPGQRPSRGGQSSCREPLSGCTCPQGTVLLVSEITVVAPRQKTYLEAFQVYLDSLTKALWFNKLYNAM